MTRLEAHRRRFELDERRGELLRLDELTVEEVGLLNSSFFEKIGNNPPEDLAGMYRIYLETLHQWGIICPHPIDRRDYSTCGRWYECSLCQTAVIR